MRDNYESDQRDGAVCLFEVRLAAQSAVQFIEHHVIASNA